MRSPTVRCTLGAMFVIRLAEPREVGTAAQGGYTAVVDGRAIGLATLAARPLYAAYGARAYRAMAALGGVGLLLAARFAARRDGGPLARA